MSKILFVICILHIFFVSCTCISHKADDKIFSNDSLSSNIIHEINLEDATRENSSADFNSLIKNVNFINLECNESSQLSDLNFMIEKIKNKFIVSSFRSEGLFQFDSVGNYEKTLITKGKAKNELSSHLYRWSYNEQKNILTVSTGYKLLNYSFENHKSDGVYNDKFYYNTIMLNDGTYVALPNIDGNGSEESAYLDFLNKEGKKIKDIKYFYKRDLKCKISNEYDGPMETYALYSDYRGSALFRDIYNDTVYTVTNSDNIEPYIILKRGRFAPTVKDDNLSRKREKIFVKDIRETSKYIFVKYHFNEYLYCILWSKIEGKIVYKNSLEFNNQNVRYINYPHFVNYTTSQNKNIIIGVVAFCADRIYCIANPTDIEGGESYDNPLLIEVFLQ